MTNKSIDLCSGLFVAKFCIFRVSFIATQPAKFTSAIGCIAFSSAIVLSGWLLISVNTQSLLEGSYELGSGLPSVCPSGSFLGSGAGPIWECAWLVEKNFFCPKNGENGPRIVFLEFIEKFSYWFFLNLVYNGSLYYFLYSYTNPILEKIRLLKYGPKYSLANHITGFLDQMYL